MPDNENIVVKRYVVGWAIAIMATIITTGATLFYKIGSGYIGYKEYVQENEGEKKLMWQAIGTNTRQVNADMSAITDQQKQLSDMKTIVDKHETYFDIMKNNPRNSWRMFASNSK